MRQIPAKDASWRDISMMAPVFPNAAATECSRHAIS